MKCEDFLAARDSKSLWRRWQASRHVACCHECQATAATADDLRRELGQVEPLPAALRELWVNSADETAVHTTGRRHARQWLAPSLAAAAMLLLSASLLIWSGSGPTSRPPKQIIAKVGGTDGAQEPLVPGIERFGPSSLFGDLMVSVDALQREIESTIKQAELLDARKQADEMIVAYSKW